MQFISIEVSIEMKKVSVNKDRSLFVNVSAEKGTEPDHEFRFSGGGTHEFVIRLRPEQVQYYLINLSKGVLRILSCL